MNASTPVPKDHPLMIAWEAHKVTEEYANSLRWAADPRHVEGSLWALFAAGWEAAQPKPKPAVKDGCCELCGEPMPPGETMFKFHGYSGPCPKPATV